MSLIRELSILKNYQWVSVDTINGGNQYVSMKTSDLANEEDNHLFLYPSTIKETHYSLEDSDSRTEKMDPYMKQVREISHDIWNSVYESDSDITPSIEDAQKYMSEYTEELKGQSTFLQEKLKRSTYADIRAQTTTDYESVGLPLVSNHFNVELFKRFIDDDKNRILSNIRSGKMKDLNPYETNVFGPIGKKEREQMFYGTQGNASELLKSEFFKDNVLGTLDEYVTLKKELYAIDIGREWCGYPNQWTGGFLYLLSVPCPFDPKGNDAMVLTYGGKTLVELREYAPTSTMFGHLCSIFEHYATKKKASYDAWSKSYRIPGLILENRFYHVATQLVKDLQVFKTSLDREYYSPEEVSALGKVPIYPLQFGEEGKTSAETVQANFGLFIYRIVENIRAIPKRADQYAEVLMQIENGFRVLRECVDQWTDRMKSVLTLFKDRFCDEIWKKDIQNMIESCKLGQRIWRLTLYQSLLSGKATEEPNVEYGLIDGNLELEPSVLSDSSYKRVKGGYTSAHDQVDKIVNVLGQLLQKKVLKEDLKMEGMEKDILVNFLAIPFQQMVKEMKHFEFGQRDTSYSSNYFKKDAAASSKSIGTSSLDRMGDFDMSLLEGKDSSISSDSRSIVTGKTSFLSKASVTYKIRKDVGNDLWSACTSKNYRIWKKGKTEDIILKRVFGWPGIYVGKMYGAWLLSVIQKTIEEDMEYKKQAIYFFHKYMTHVKNEVPWNSLIHTVNESKAMVQDILDYQYDVKGQEKVAKDVAIGFGELYEKQITHIISIFIQFYKTTSLLSYPVGITDDLKKRLEMGREGLIGSLLYYSNWLYLYPKIVRDVYDAMEKESKEQQVISAGDVYAETRMLYPLRSVYADETINVFKKIFDKKKKELKELGLKKIAEKISYRSRFTEGDLKKIQVSVKNDDIMEYLKKMDKEFEKIIAKGITMPEQRGILGKIFNTIRSYYNKEEDVLEKRIETAEDKGIIIGTNMSEKDANEAQKKRLDALRQEVSHYANELKDIYQKNQSILQSIEGKPPIISTPEMSVVINQLPTVTAAQVMPTVPSTAVTIAPSTIPVAVPMAVPTSVPEKEEKKNEVATILQAIQSRSKGHTIFIPLMEFKNDSLDEPPIKIVYMNVTMALSGNHTFREILFDMPSVEATNTYHIVVSGAAKHRGRTELWRIIPFHYLNVLTSMNGQKLRENILSIFKYPNVYDSSLSIPWYEESSAKQNILKKCGGSERSTLIRCPYITSIEEVYS
jgi:hypothetical protein